jgi:hypothetical protein
MKARMTKGSIRRGRRNEPPRVALRSHGRQARPRVEQLETRTLLSPGIQPQISHVAEDFEAANSLAAYTTVLRYAPAAELSAAAAHDGGLGLVKHDGYEWMIRNDYPAEVHAGEIISVWAQLAGAADGRALARLP